MKHAVWVLLVVLVPAVLAADGDKLLGVRSQAELDAAITSMSDPALRRALTEHAAAVLAAATEHTHAAAVARVVEASSGKIERANTTPEAIQRAAGGELAVFDTLKLVDLAVPNTSPHDKRAADLYDTAFFEHLGQLKSLESLHVITTKLDDDGIGALAGLANLKSLKFTNNGKLTDVGLEKLAGLNKIETFSFVGTGMQGHAFAKFEGWTRLTKCSFRGSSIDDEGLRLICERFPNLESLGLAHAKLVTDAGAVHLPKLTKLKNLELGSRNATPACLANLRSMRLEYLQLGDGLDAAEGIAQCKQLPTLRRLTLTHCEKLDDDAVRLATELKQLEQLEIGGLPISDERAASFAGFAFLKSLVLANRPKGYPPEIEAKIRASLPNVAVTFV
ncbi:MAG TPA: hypothetical protein VG713_19885, partial [Pirellulales bacterium]|nr:hypothetical protein [Pirellulales bacterium]